MSSGCEELGTASIDNLHEFRDESHDSPNETFEKQDHPDDTEVPVQTAVRGVEDATTQALRFLSTATNATICGIAVGLAASTYLVLGRLGLVLIGALGGIVLHAAWERQSVAAGAIGDARYEKGLDVATRLLNWRETTHAVREADDQQSSPAYNTLSVEDFEDFRPETAAALTGLVQAVIRDYVKWWYGPVLPSDESFPAACQRTLTGFIRSISTHMARKRPADTFIDFLTNSSSIFIVFLSELSAAINMTGGNISAAEAVEDYLLTNPESSLANILNDTQQKKKFKMIAEDILENFLDKAVYAADPSRIFLREMLSGVVLEMSLTTCSKPEWINGWIVYLLEKGESDISHAIDIGMGSDTIESLNGSTSGSGIAAAKISEEKKHQKRLSRAEEAMDEAVEEAKRLSDLMAEENKKDLSDVQPFEQEVASKGSKISDWAAPENSTLSAAGLPRKLGDTKGIREDVITDVSSITTERKHEAPPATAYDTGTTSDLASSDGSIGQATPTTGSGHSSPKMPAALSTSSFTTFDQILPVSHEIPAAEDEPPQPRRRESSSFTLHNAHITVHDDSLASDRGKIWVKPTGDYWVQMEPESSQYPGWMIMRKYTDFEMLHEVLRRIAVVSGVNAFLETHKNLPDWKAHTKPSLRGELERYLRDACWYQQLAESEGMRRFLEKDQAQSSNNGKGFPALGWPTPAAFENMGKGMLDALTVAPKTAAKDVFEGVTGVFGSLAKKRESTLSLHTAGRASTTTLPKTDGTNSLISPKQARASEDSSVASIIPLASPKACPLERKSSCVTVAEDGTERRVPLQGRRRSKSRSTRSSANNSRETSRAPLSTGVRIASPREVEAMILPPPPSDIADDYVAPGEASFKSGLKYSDLPGTSISNAPSVSTPDRLSVTSVDSPRMTAHNLPSVMSPSRLSMILPELSAPTPVKPKREFAAISEPETRVAVELLFAIISELYTLSSAWNFRRTLLTAAKTYLLRPGNPSLLGIQSLIQESIIVANTSDAGLGEQLRKLRANTMPTTEELAQWPAEMTDEEKEKLKIKARNLLVERGMPAALTGVMGQAATSEAVGRVFDCLQIERVARGLMFGLLLQGVRAMTT